MTGLALLLAVPAAAGDFAPPAAELVAEARRTAADILAGKVVEGLKDIRTCRDRELECGGAPLCLADRIYYDKASVDALVGAALEAAPDMVKRGLLAPAAAAVSSIRRARLYDGAKLVPSRTPLYPAAEVDAKVSSVLALLERPAAR